MSIPKKYVETYNGQYSSDDRAGIRSNLDNYLTNEGLPVGKDFVGINNSGNLDRVCFYHFRDATIRIESTESQILPNTVHELEVRIIASELSVAEGLGKHLRSIALGDQRSTSQLLDKLKEVAIN